ncbi:transglycosylase domain-containing protein [Thalassospira sp. TSL5-1]|uniref:transglycosylase domain-containing protein n=1 Tax=Thalassospira sp. TSL5-1 TaxID=1544451 RepID=UPI00093E65F4|nr:PBP1A family penicillin-binding protein [Thalassospira sp. TSL5-1]OKH86623.1 penicillin-binding protein [Thalassospira sp. TSL5-1]
MAKRPTRNTSTPPRRRAPRKTGGGSSPRGRGRRRAGQKKSFGGFLRAFVPRPMMLARVMVVLAIWSAVLCGGLVAYYGYDLTSKIDFNVATQRKPLVRIMSIDGVNLANYGDRYGRPVEVGDLPDYVGQAFVSIEDRRFYQHFGIDVIGIARAFVQNIWRGRIAQGGSTITQQLAKNLFLSPERSYGRKIEEVLLSLWLEIKFSKRQILSLYLNRIYFGSGVYGIDAAARQYFGVDPRRLSLYQAAVLAGLPKAPSRYNPLIAPRDAAKRANQVIAAMLDTGAITARQAQANHFDRVTTSSASGRGGPNVRYFTDWILDRVTDYVGYHDQDMVVYTSLDSNLQASAEDAVNRVLDSREADRRKVSQGALVAMTPDGSVRAMVGGKNFFQSQYNRVTQAKRQPGSVFKLFVYLAALEDGMRADDWMRDEPYSVNGWSPRNFDRQHHGTLSLRDAVASSNNVIAVEVAMKTGLNHVIDMAHKLGVSSDLPAEPSLALGTSEVSLLEMTTAYAVVSNGGFNIIPHAITKIVGQNGEILYERGGGYLTRVLNPVTAGEMNNMLAAVMAKGTGKNALLDRPAAGKTGTTSDYRDAWFVGYTADLVAGVWLGNDNGSPMEEVTGGGLPAEMWKSFMLHAHQDLPVRSLGKAASMRAIRMGEDDSWKKFNSGFTGKN